MKKNWSQTIIILHEIISSHKIELQYSARISKPTFIEINSKICSEKIVYVIIILKYQFCVKFYDLFFILLYILLSVHYISTNQYCYK